MNVVLLVVDSLRARSLGPMSGNPRTPFLEQFSRETVCFRRAYATECWTLPTHCSMFTGLLPSEHQAHFQTMGYALAKPTLAEILAEAGLHTEVVTRNFIFDGTLPGITRGFRRHTQRLADRGALNPFALFLALAKPRFRRHVRRTGFFHPLQRQSREFLARFARAMMPADRSSLDHTLHLMETHHRKGTPYFVFVNLYDVHAPYPPTPNSILRSFWSLQGIVENCMFPSVMAKLGEHAYLMPNFRLSERGRSMLLGRYHRAIELMDATLSEFMGIARQRGLLDDTLLVLTSDHGEAFGEHGLYLHDASVYDTHLRVPLWVHHPAHRPETVDDVVSTRDLFGLMRAAGLGGGCGETILDAGYRRHHAIAVAEHFYYPHANGMRPCYRQNLTAFIGGWHKVVVRREGVLAYDLERDDAETAPGETTIDQSAATWRRAGIPAETVHAAVQRLRAWQTG